jgi:hypothetical protein
VHQIVSVGFVNTVQCTHRKRAGGVFTFSWEFPVLK